MELLRDLRETTRVLFLYEITANRHSRLRTIAERLGMTVQGASDYAKGLEEDGLLTLSSGEYRATKRGVEFLLARTRDLKAFVESVGRSIASVEVTAAMAGSAVRRGARVGLFMEQGHLVAHPGRPSPSVGIAAHDAAKGDDLAVRDLDGIVALRPGRIVLARVPDIRAGGARQVSLAAARKVLRKARGAVVAALDVSGLVASRRLGLRPRIEFGVLPASVEAAENGLNVLLLVPEERMAEAVQAIETANAKLEDKIPYESVGLG